MLKKHKILIILFITLTGLSLFGQNTKEKVPFFSTEIEKNDSIISQLIYSNPKKAIDLTLKLLEQQNNNLDNIEKANLYSTLRRIYHLSNDPYSALYYGYKALLIYKLYNKPSYYNEELNKIACIYRDKKIYDNAIIKLLNENLDNAKNYNLDYYLLNKANLLLIYKLSAQQSSITIDEITSELNKVKNKKHLAQLYKIITFYYTANKEYSKAIASLKKAIFLSTNPHQQIRLYLDLCEIYLKEKNIPSANEILEKLYPKIKKHNDLIALIQWYLLKSQVKLYENNINQAINYAQRGLRLSIENDLMGYQGDFYKILSELYMQASKPDLAFISFSNYIQIKDAIHSLDNYNKLNSIILKINSVDIKKENLLLKEQAKYEELKNRQQKLISIVFGLSVVLLSLLLALVYYLLRNTIKSEQRLKKFAKISLEAILIIENEKILEFNDKFTQLTGYTQKEIKNLKITQLLDPILAKQITENNNIINFETYLKRKNNSQFKAEVLVRPFNLSHRKKVKIISIRDVSYFYDTQKELIESQIKFKTLIETSPDGVILTEPSGKINFISQSACKILEIENKKQLLGKNITEILRDKSPFSILMTSEDKPIEFVFELKKNHTHHKYIETKFSYVKAYNDEIIAFFLIIRDVTTRIKTEEALAQSEKKFKKLYTKASDGLLIANQNWEIIDSNPASEKIFAISTKQLKGKNIFNLIPNIKEKQINLLDGSGKFETTIRKKDGTILYVQISISQLEEKPPTYLLIIRDITEIIKNQEGLRQYAEKLEISNQAKDKLFSIISHDLRGPIGNLKAMIELILENPSSFNTEEIKEILKQLKDSSVSTFELLENLLYWAKSQLNQIEYSPKTFNIYDPIQQSINILKQAAKQKDININVNIDENSYFVNADIEMVKIILRNLISNAIKFTPRGGSITLLNYQDQDAIIIGVKDTGVGIPYEKLVKIFDSNTFFTTYGTENEKGTGLGLQIVKEFVAKNKGKLWVESKPNKGTTFYFSLPKANT